MSWNYKHWVKAKIEAIISSGSYGLSVQISDEQAFTKIKDYSANTIYIVIKELSSSIEYNTKTTPIQMLIIAEQNSLDKTKAIFNEFATTYNWYADFMDTTTYIKQQYNSPVVMSNFGDIASGYRSVLYLTVTLFIMESLLDIEYVKIGMNGGTKETISPLSFSIIYGMSGNTQQISGQTLASTVKSTATLSITMTVPFLNKTFISNIFSIMTGSTSGNATFNIEFKRRSISTATTVNMKLNSASLTTAPNQVAGFQLGFIK